MVIARIPRKRLRVAEKLRADIESGVYPFGSRLPVEKELAKEFGIAYETMRRAISVLADEKLLERCPGKGTFVCGGKREPRELYFLIPCPDYFVKSGYWTYTLTSGFLSGCLEESLRSNFSVITLPLSQTNEQKNIDWNAMRRIPKRARVIFYGIWFAPVHQYLLERECRVLVIHNIWHSPDCLRAEIPEKWATCFLNEYRQYMSFIKYFTDAGCRKICFADNHCANINTARFEGIRDGARSYADGCEIILERNSFPAETFCREIAEMYRKYHFDGLCLDLPDSVPFDYRRTLNRNLGLPESVRIVTAIRFPCNRMMTPPVPGSTFDFKEAGRISAHFLFHETYSPAVLTIEPEPIQ